MDWWSIDLYLVRKYKLRPWEIQALTLSEMALYLEPEETKGMSFTDALDEAMRWHKMTPLEKLENG